MVQDFCEEFRCDDPAVALLYYANGMDPRVHSPLMVFGKQLARDYPDSPPPVDVWMRLCNMFDDVAPFHMVDAKTSLNAAKALMPFRFAKKSEIEIEGAIAIPPVVVDREELIKTAAKLGQEL